MMVIVILYLYNLKAVPFEYNNEDGAEIYKGYKKKKS